MKHNLNDSAKDLFEDEQGSRMKIKFVAMFSLFLVAQPSFGVIKEIDLKNTKCTSDYQTVVKSLNDQCIRLVTPDAPQKETEELIIYLHGDYGIDGASYMSSFASKFPKSYRMNIALIRPGYFDDKGNFSTGSALGVTSTKIAGRLDNYTRENVDIVADAILNLKKHYKPKQILLIGHSGGAAMAALLLNFYPQLIDGALLINCPCDVKKWKPDWEKSLSPIENINHIRQKAIVHVISGAGDEVVLPELGKFYTQELLKNRNNAKFFLGIEMKHNLNDEKTGEMVLKSIQTFLDETEKNNTMESKILYSSSSSNGLKTF